MDAIHTKKQTPIDIISKISQSAMWFLITGIMIVVFSSGWDILFGSELSHPIWQAGYNWMPLLENIFVVSVLGGAAQGGIPSAVYLLTNREEKEEVPILLTRISLLKS